MSDLPTPRTDAAKQEAFEAARLEPQSYSAHVAAIDVMAKHMAKLERELAEMTNTAQKQNEFITKVMAERDNYRNMVTDVRNLINESDGVDGYHLNGDMAPWEDVLPGFLEDAADGEPTVKKSLPVQPDQFKREVRYVVNKLKDAKKYLKADEFEQLIILSQKVDIGRARDNKHPMKCVVVESDWPEYDLVWDLIEQRVDLANKPAHESGGRLKQCTVCLGDGELEAGVQCHACLGKGEVFHIPHPRPRSDLDAGHKTVYPSEPDQSPDAIYYLAEHLSALKGEDSQ